MLTRFGTLFATCAHLSLFNVLFSLQMFHVEQTCCSLPTMFHVEHNRLIQMFHVEQKLNNVKSNEL